MDIIEFAERVANTSASTILRSILAEKSVQRFIIDLNTDKQLYQGIDSEGKKLSEIWEPYAPSTKAIKRRRGQPTNRVTLKDSGDYYRSYKITPLPNGDFQITSDPIKGGKSLQIRYGDNLEGLTDENKKILNAFLEKKVYEYYANIL